MQREPHEATGSVAESDAADRHGNDTLQKEIQEQSDQGLGSRPLDQ
jgi:hypothetical protein